VARLSGRVAIVTGGARGIGRASCRALAREGARVLVADIDTDGGAAVAAEIVSGRFADEWDAEGESNYARLEELRAAHAGPAMRAFEAAQAQMGQAAKSWPRAGQYSRPK